MIQNSYLFQVLKDFSCLVLKHGLWGETGTVTDGEGMVLRFGAVSVFAS